MHQTNICVIVFDNLLFAKLILHSHRFSFKWR